VGFQREINISIYNSGANYKMKIETKSWIERKNKLTSAKNQPSSHQTRPNGVRPGGHQTSDIITSDILF